MEELTLAQAEYLVEKAYETNTRHHKVHPTVYVVCEECMSEPN